MQVKVNTPTAPVPLARYSQGIIAGNLVFVSAMLGQDMATGKLITENIEAETRQVMENIKAILAEAGADFGNVIKASIFLKDMQDYARVNAVYGSYVTEPFPARETIQVGGLPMNVNVEISVIAVRA
jgi:2-iminobutanoate/2-iminopropanoate deaminase